MTGVQTCALPISDPAEILRVIPEAGPVREAYLLYVVSRPRVEAIAAAARGVQDERLLLVATDVLIEAGRYADAVEVWRELGHAAPEGVTSPRFAGEASGRGFDWRFINSDGVTHQQLEQGRGHRVRLSGTQGEQAALLSQYVGGLKKGTRYRLRVEVDGAPEGLQWRLAGEPVTDEFTAKSEVALLQLWYERPRGAVRAEADFDLKEVTVSALQ